MTYSEAVKRVRRWEQLVDGKRITVEVLE